MDSWQDVLSRKPKESYFTYFYKFYKSKNTFYPEKWRAKLGTQQNWQRKAWPTTKFQNLFELTTSNILGSCHNYAGLETQFSALTSLNVVPTKANSPYTIIHVATSLSFINSTMTVQWPRLFSVGENSYEHVHDFIVARPLGKQLWFLL